MSKSTKAQEYAAQEKKEYTIKVWTLAKIVIVLVLMGVSFAGGWFTRSDFANEVKGEVRSQMSAIKAVDSVSKTNQ